MGLIASTFADAFRDYVTAGVPASGEHEPIKSEIREIGPIIESALGVLSLGSVAVTYATRAELESDLAHAADSTALVYADATDDNNDLYVKTGASGSGSWVLTATLHTLVDGLAAPAIARARNAVPFESWESLAAAEQMLPDDRATVMTSDTGTHTDPVTASLVANAGVYIYRASPLGWERVSDLDSQTASNEAERAEAAAAAGAGAYWESVRFPAENGENRQGENGGLMIPNTPSLLRRSSAGDAPMFGAPFAIAVLWRVPREVYDGLRRAPTILGNERIGSATANRQLKLGYVARADNGNVANAGRFRFRVIGEAGLGSVDIYSATPDSNFSHDALVVARYDGSNFVLDFWDCATGAKGAGTPVAKPGSWAGVTTITGNLGIGTPSPALFPQDNTNLGGHQNTSYSRGECGGVLFLDSFGTDSEFQQMALGADPLAVWPAAVRKWFPLVDGAGARDNAGYQNLASPVTHADALSQLGALHPGGSIRRQTAAKYLVAPRLSDPALINLPRGADSGVLRVPLTMAGQNAGDAIESRVLSATGQIVRDWGRCGDAVAAGTVTVSVPLAPGLYNVLFRTRAGQTVCALNSTISVGLGILVNGQSQADYAFSLGMSELGNDTALNLRWSGDHAERCFVAALGPVPTVENKFPAIFRAAQKPGIFGNGIIAFFNRMARDISAPIHLIETAVSGTTIEDTLENGGSPNDRNMSDIYAITNLLTGKDTVGRSVLTAWVQFWHSSGSVEAYAEAFMPPMLYGETVGSIAPNDWFFSGLSLNPNFDFIHMEPNRIIATSLGAASDTDSRTEHLTRANLRTNEGAFGYVLGAPIDMHRLEGNVFTHGALQERYGAPWQAEIVAESVKRALGRGGWRGPVEVATARFTDGTRTAIDVRFTGPAGFRLATLNGGLPTGFEVDNNRSTFTAAIVGARTVRLTRTSGSWSAGAFIEHKPGGPGNYGTGFDEAAFVNGALVNAQDGMLARGTIANVGVSEA